MKDTKRALRRHHRARMIHHAMRSYVIGAFDDEGWAERRTRATYWADNLAKCSCYLCGNPRKFEGRLTVQERRQEDAARYELATELWPRLARQAPSRVA